MSAQEAFEIPTEWKGILLPTERILWQGTPSGKLRLEFRSLFEPLFLLFFIGFSVFWMVGAAKAPGPFWMFGLLFFFTGIYNLILAHFWAAFVRTRTHLTLTSQRAIIATVVFGRRKLKTYPINQSTKLELVEGALGSVFFAENEIRDSESSTIVPVGFEMISNPREVFAIFLEVQRGNHDP